MHGGANLPIAAESPCDDAAAGLRFRVIRLRGLAAKRLPLDLPPNFELSFSVRGDLPQNNLEFKLVDETGENVWWVNRRAFEFPQELDAARHRGGGIFSLPGGRRANHCRKASAIEIVVASAEGGRGTIWLDDLTFRPLPESKPYTGTPTATATSTARDSAAEFAVDGKPDTEWQSEPAIDRSRR